jgi:hypothetical protein
MGKRKCLAQSRCIFALKMHLESFLIRCIFPISVFQSQFFNLSYIVEIRFLCIYWKNNTTIAEEPAIERNEEQLNAKKTTLKRDTFWLVSILQMERVWKKQRGVYICVCRIQKEKKRMIPMINFLISHMQNCRKNRSTFWPTESGSGMFLVEALDCELKWSPVLGEESSRNKEKSNKRWWVQANLIAVPLHNNWGIRFQNAPLKHGQIER